MRKMIETCDRCGKEGKVEPVINFEMWQKTKKERRWFGMREKQIYLSKTKITDLCDNCYKELNKVINDWLKGGQNATR